MGKHRRRTYLIKTGLQLRYMGIIVSTMLLVAFGVGWIIYYTSWSRISDTPDLTIDKLAEIFDQVNGVLLKWVAVFLLIIASLSIFVSHKIAGPVYRFERLARVITKGDLTQSVRLRSGDELRELQDAFNSMTDSLRRMVTKDREVIAKLVAAGNKLNDVMKKKKQDPAEIESVAQELYGIIEELRNVTAGFRIDKELASETTSTEGSSEEEEA
ncbi:MAG TPA: methyl-accepting chemotaxis protein [Candidatus Ozemobacteraceae bacterium]|nr:methyl-accepting chemotaxis protein [Candidatus Ozemobacteraceae bacterium]